MKANELSTTEKLANLKTASFKHKYENLLSLLHIFFWPDWTNIVKNTANMASSHQTKSYSDHFPSYCRINITKRFIKHKVR